MDNRNHRITFLQAAKAVLEEIKQPMHFKKITELAIQKGYLETKGKTPEWTMGARLSVDIKKRGRASEFIRMGSGRYGLRVWKRAFRTLIPRSQETKDRRYWLVSVDPKNFEADIRNGSLDLVGVKGRMLRTLEKIRPGEAIVVYLKRVAQFAAILKAEGEAYTDGSERWPVGSEELTARIKCKPELITLGTARLDARPLYDELELFNQYPAKHRTLALRNGITEISKADYENISNNVRRVVEMPSP